MTRWTLTTLFLCTLACTCGPPPGESDSTWWQESDADADADTDADADVPWAVLGWEVEVAGDGEQATSGSEAYVLYPYNKRAEDWETTPLCKAIAPLTSSGLRPPEGCNGCIFTYSVLSSDGITEGDDCAHYVNWSGSEVAGDELSIGFAPAYDFGGYVLPTVLMYMPDRPQNGWFPVSIHAPPFYTVVGDADSVRMTRVFRDPDYGSPYVYYYTP